MKQFGEDSNWEEELNPTDYYTTTCCYWYFVPLWQKFKLFCQFKTVKDIFNKSSHLFPTTSNKPPLSPWPMNVCKCCRNNEGDSINRCNRRDWYRNQRNYYWNKDTTLIVHGRTVSNPTKFTKRLCRNYHHNWIALVTAVMIVKLLIMLLLSIIKHPTSTKYGTKYPRQTWLYPCID